MNALRVPNAFDRREEVMKKRKDDLCYRLAIAFCVKFCPFMPWVKKAKAEKKKKTWRYLFYKLLT